MKSITLGSTGITVPQNGFGALPIQRISKENAVKLLRRAYEGGMRYFDTARGYTDSEEKLGLAFGDGWLKREEVYIATKTHDSGGILEGSGNLSETPENGLYRRLPVPQPVGVL